jgi:tetratricopeptide (TPR) repeat protein
MDQAANNTERKEQLIGDGHAAFDAGDFTRALDFYHRAALLDANDITVWTSLGLTFNNLDFPREAWRSYLLALNIEPSNANSLWYASEFLYEIEDLPLADLFLGHYLQVEEDPEKLDEARQLREEIRAEGKARGISFDDARSTDAQHMLDNPDQPALDDEPGENEAEDTLSEDWRMSEDELEQAALSGGRFTPPLSLRLLGSDGMCQHCKLQIPLDAPYCWSCKMIHFYE